MTLFKTNESSNAIRFYGVAFFVFIVSVTLIHNNSVSIWDQDEGAYASFAKNMLQTGNWLVPQAMWSEIHRKPPLHFWNIALAFKLFGLNEFALRLPAALLTCFTYVLIFLGGRKLFGKQISFTALQIISTSVLVPIVAKVSVVDSTLLFFTTLCAFSILFVLLHRNKIFVFVFWLSFALALLTKGPPIILFSIIFTVTLFIFHPNRKNLVLLHPWFFLPLAILPFAYWCYLTTLTDGGVFLKWMYDWYVLKRINGSVLGQTGLPGTHLLVMLLCFFPYFMFFPALFKSLISGIRKNTEHEIIFAAWFFAAWFIYELSPSKLPAYVLPAHVPLAFLLAQILVKKNIPSIISLLLHYTIQLIIALAIIIASCLLPLPSSAAHVFFGVGALLLLSSGISFYVVKIKQNIIASTIGYGLVFQFLLWFVAIPQIDKLKHVTKEIAGYVEHQFPNNHVVVIGNSQWSPPSLPFYLSLNKSNILEERRITELAAHYCSDSNVVLILSKHQHEIFDTVFGYVHSKKMSNPEIVSGLTNDYFVFDNTQIVLTDTSCFPQPNLPCIASDYEKEIRNSVNWFSAMQEAAQKQGKTTDEMVTETALWCKKRDHAIYNFELRLNALKKWRALMEKQAIVNHLSPQQVSHDAVVLLLNGGEVY
ncbi:MAG: glycosyltransferase family 39 protein [Bacteroidetes bacterium]|nr:glycosyltransferase family 39 protein [Bacteroidota bacterium]